MSAELNFKRPGRVELRVSKSEAGFMYVTVWQWTSKGSQHLATTYAIDPAQCRLVNYGDAWVLSAAEARYHLKLKGFEQVRDTFGIQVYEAAQS